MNFKFDVGDKVVHTLDRGIVQGADPKPQKVIGMIIERRSNECYRHTPQNTYQVRWLSQGADLEGRYAISFNHALANHSEIELEAAPAENKS